MSKYVGLCYYHGCLQTLTQAMKTPYWITVRGYPLPKFTTTIIKWSKFSHLGIVDFLSGACALGFAQECGWGVVQASGWRTGLCGQLRMGISH